jgi:uncharacterized protein YbjT (DUF2867 family)
MSHPRDQRRVLVTGASGYLGGRLVPRLLERGHHVRCLARDPARLAGRGWAAAEMVRGDVLEPETLPAALEGIETAYYLVHAMAAGPQFAERDRTAARNFAQAAKAAGVSQVIYLGGLQPTDGALSLHLRSRKETGEILRQQGPPVTEFRAGIIIGSGSISFEMIRYLTERLPIMLCPKWVDTLTQPIGIRDVLAYLIAGLETPAARGQVYEIGAADRLRYRDLMMTYARLRGLRRYCIVVPVLTPGLSARWIDLVTPIPAAFARPLVEGLKSELLVRDHAAATTFPQIRPDTCEEAMRIALDRTARDQRETIWSMPLSSSLRSSPKPIVLEQQEGLFIERRKVKVAASAESVFRVFCGVGGQRGWFGYEWAWHLRGLLDRLVGGPGLRRGRRHADDLYAGEAVDFWRVEEVIHPETPGEFLTPDGAGTGAGGRLRLRAEMRLPGRAWLQFDAQPLAPDRCELTQTAFFESHGVWGMLYWYALVPMHLVIFGGMARAIARQAEEQERMRSMASV